MAVNPKKTASKAGKHKASPTGAKNAPRAKQPVVIPQNTAYGDSRKLTVGERRMMVPIFKDSIYYDDVKIFNAKYVPRQDGYGVTPNGNLYAPGKNVFSEDYSKQNPKGQIWFMHEMTHVWQWNRGYPVKSQALIPQAISLTCKAGETWVYEYYYPENMGKKLPEFNMEQQAEIISHYYGAKYLNAPKYVPKLQFLESVLADFLIEPRAVALLPGYGKFSRQQHKDL